MTVFDADAAAPRPLTAAQLGLLLAQGDLGYICAALAGGVTERALAFLQYSVFVAFEAYAFCTQQLGIDIPPLAWDENLAAASRNSAKFFDEKRRDLAQLTAEVNALADATREAFTGGVGWMRRALGIDNPDLGVLFVASTPVQTTVTMAHYAGGQVPGPANLAQAGGVAHDLAQGVGEMVGLLDAHLVAHRPPASDLDAEYAWRDGASPACYAEAFAGDLPATQVPLMLMLHGAVATAALLARTDCCGDCRFAAFKHRLVVAHHVARSLERLRETRALCPAAGTRVNAMLAEAPVVEVVGMRALRNGLVHFGLSDVPASAFASPDPRGSLVAHYAAGRGYAEVRHIADDAVTRLRAHLTDWLLTAPPGGTGITGRLRAPV